MRYTGELAQIQQAASRTADYGARRAATFENLTPAAREIILEVGCGSGLFVKQMAEAVGPSREVLVGWSRHAPFPNLPAVLRPRLARANFSQARSGSNLNPQHHL